MLESIVFEIEFCPILILEGNLKISFCKKDNEQSSGRAVTVIRSFVNGIVPYPVGEIMQLKQKVSIKPRRFVSIPEIENNGDGPITTFDYGAKLVPQPGSLKEHEVTGQSDYRV